ncbi:MAG: hypothetical protein JXB35_08935 [Anaerolineae bacterium]|nr:hypothetical protein [Anaerolineae bacterium]
MSSKTATLTIGNVLRSDIRGFVVASRIPEPDVPTFGTFVRAPIQQGNAHLIGLVYDIRLQDDPFLRDLAVSAAESDPDFAEVIRDQREVRAVPVEISVVAVGYTRGDEIAYGLPPQPPMILHRIQVCSKEEARRITAKPDFLRPLLDNRDAPVDELVVRVLQRAAPLHSTSSTTREDYLLQASRYLARFLAREPLRLETILRQLA